MRFFHFSKKKTILFYSFLTIFILGTILIFIVPLSVRSTYGLTTQTDDGAIISFNVFEPVTGGSSKPAFIIGHGSMVNKEMVKGYALELAAAGFVAVPFDFRGHGQSTTGETDDMTKDILSIMQYLNSRGDIDMTSLGYIGYSMGGLGQVVIENDNGFKCFIGIGTWLNSSLRIGDSTNPLNVLMIQAFFDEAVELSILKESLSVRVGVPLANTDVNKLYGSFQTGNASKIYLDDDSNHLKVAWDQDFIRQARDWAINSFDIDVQDENFYVNVRGIILLIQVIGGIGFFFMLIEPLSRKASTSRKEAERNVSVVTYKRETPNISVNSLVLKSIIYSLILAIPGIIIFLPILLLLPLAVGAFVIALLFGQAFALLLLIWRVGKKANFSLKETLIEPFKDRKRFLRELILGAILGGFLYVIAYVSIGLNYLGLLPAITKIWTIPIYFILNFLVILVLNVVIQAIIQPKLTTSIKDTTKMIFIGFIVPFLYFLVYLLILGLITRSFFYLGTFTPISLVMFTLSSAVSVIAYRKTGSIITSTVINALLLTFLIVTMSPPQSGLSFILRFIR